MVLPADQAAALVIMLLQQAVRQGHQDRVLLAVTILRRFHIQPAVAAVHLRLAQMLRHLHLAQEVQELRHQSPDRL
jgi:hypothetical protein